jgi:hypothetical protein
LHEAADGGGATPQNLGDHVVGKVDVVAQDDPSWLAIGKP